MLPKETIEKIKKEIETFFEKMGVEVEIETLTFQNSTIFVNLKTSQPSFLIGEQGERLFQIQHLLRLILRKKIEKEIFLDLDIGGYKKKRIAYLKELARAVADEVGLTKKERVLEPMPAFERRIIHLELASRADVTTESIGREPNRRVVIKPYP